MRDENLNTPAEVNPQLFSSLIHEIRGTLVMLDADLADIYGYSTKAFNRQIKNNLDRFDEEDFMFQLTNQEFADLKLKFSTSSSKQEFTNLRSKNLTSNEGDEENLRCKNYTSSSAPNWGGRRYAPYAFTEQGVYMLMAILKGPYAVKQSKALIRLFKLMKDYIMQNQPLLGQREYLQLSIQTSDNIRDIMELRSSLSELDDKVAKMADEMGQVVTQSQLSEVLLDFGKPAVRRGWLILNGQAVESDLAYKQIYTMAKESVILIDDFINLKTLSQTRDVATGVKVTVLSENTHGYLHKHEVEDYRKEFSGISLSLISNGGIFHDRYIMIDYGTPDEHLYHCGASSKDGGNKVMSIITIDDAVLYHPLFDKALKNPELVLK